MSGKDEHRTKPKVPKKVKLWISRVKSRRGTRNGKK